MTPSAIPPLKQQLKGRDLVVAPGIFDMISVKVADAVGFNALYMTGYGVTASYLGLPDAGITTYTDMVSRIRATKSISATPLVADGDTGYGGLLNVQHTVRGYEAAGAAAIQLEDQEFPKKCGHMLGRRVIALEDMVAKIRVAVESRDSADFLIVARTDARTGYGLDEALKRGAAYAEAGADVLFIESPESTEEMAKICQTFDTPLLVNMVEGGRTPVLSAKELTDLGYTLAIYPVTGFLAMGAALKSVYGHIKATGSSTGDTTPLENFEAFSRLMGFEHVWDFEKRWAGKG